MIEIAYLDKTTGRARKHLCDLGTTESAGQSKAMIAKCDRMGCALGCTMDDAEKKSRRVDCPGNYHRTGKKRCMLEGIGMPILLACGMRSRQALLFWRFHDTKIHAFPYPDFDDVAQPKAIFWSDKRALCRRFLYRFRTMCLWKQTGMASCRCATAQTVTCCKRLKWPVLSQRAVCLVAEWHWPCLYRQASVAT